MVNLQKQKSLLESLAKEYETRVHRLKRIITAKRGYLKALQMDIHKYQKKSDDFIMKIGDKIENHKNIADYIIPVKSSIDNVNWSIEGFMDDE